MGINKPRPLLEVLEGLEKIEEIKRNVGPSLKNARQNSGIGQRELARRIGVSQTYLSLIESGKKSGSTPVLRAAYEVINDPERGSDGDKQDKDKDGRKKRSRKGGKAGGAKHN